MVTVVKETQGSSEITTLECSVLYIKFFFSSIMKSFNVKTVEVEFKLGEITNA